MSRRPVPTPSAGVFRPARVANSRYGHRPLVDAAIELIISSSTPTMVCRRPTEGEKNVRRDLTRRVGLPCAILPILAMRRTPGSGKGLALSRHVCTAPTRSSAYFFPQAHLADHSRTNGLTCFKLID
ncbi:hypothetical protein EVAR_4990_1 [Eumeta japonica]|uniref:Uncharacterized protein n=1 Tax=Eumeta variegata TaxID=151549 RepID=A0A4C1UZ64_EUMVA|nr:hypothetical protein EVAR_4990_1 [Eumeta japonica]